MMLFFYKLNLKRKMFKSNNIKEIQEILDNETLHSLSKYQCLPDLKTKIDCSGGSDLGFLNFEDTVFLEELDCSNCELIQLPELPTILTTLNCSHNKLTKLPRYLKRIQLTSLNCSYNELIKLPEFKNKIHSLLLNCSNNKLIELPNLSFGHYDNKLKFYLDCSNNKISKLPIITFKNMENADVINLNLSNNNLHSLGDLLHNLPKKIKEFTLNISNNPIQHKIIPPDGCHLIISKNQIELLKDNLNNISIVDTIDEHIEEKIDLYEDSIYINECVLC